MGQAMRLARITHQEKSSENRRRRLETDGPSTLRMPTSLARWEDWAVDRFMKLMQAISRINRAMAVKIRI
jgi:hypothetical protein